MRRAGRLGSLSLSPRLFFHVWPFFPALDAQENFRTIQVGGPHERANRGEISGQLNSLEGGVCSEPTRPVTISARE